MQQYNDANDYFNHSRIQKKNSIDQQTDQGFDFKINVFKTKIEAIQSKNQILDKKIKKCKKDENGNLQIKNEKKEVFGQ